MPKDSRRVAGGTGQKKERERQASTAVKEKTQPEAERLLEEVLRRENMLSALRRVRSNKGAPGIDGMTVEELVPYLKMGWPRIREELLEGTYQPAPVRQVEIPKPKGDGMRPLGIPTVLDRMIQQAILQVLTPIFDPHFSNSSYGFRPGRCCQDAVKAAQGYAGSGYRFVVDLDLERFFDRVSHDVLMARVARRVKDKRLLRLLRKYLESGVMVGGVIQEREEGTPQGGPLLRQVKGSGGAGDGVHRSLLRETASPEGQSRKECRGSTLEEGIPGVYDDLAPPTEAQSITGFHSTDQG